MTRFRNWVHVNNKNIYRLLIISIILLVVPLTNRVLNYQNNVIYFIYLTVVIALYAVLVFLNIKLRKANKSKQYSDIS